MGILKNVRQLFEDGGLPLGGTLFGFKSEEFKSGYNYSYDAMTKMLEDERIYGIIALMSSWAQKSYSGVYVEQEDEFVDGVLTNDEKEALKIAKKWCDDYINIRKLFFDYTWDIMLYGDVFELISKTTDGISLKSLPLRNLIVTDSSTDTGLETRQITSPKFVNVVEDKQTNIVEYHKIDDVLHLSYKNRAVWRKDRFKRDTYGIYSIPPFACLQYLIRWKQKSIENDIIWKNKLLPRIVYTLKMPSILANKFTGKDYEEKLQKAKDAGQKLFEEVKSSTRFDSPDQDLLLSDGIEAKILEPNTAKYHSPNELISQINQILNTPSGIPNGQLGGDGQQSGSAEMAAVFGGIRINKIVEDIAFNLSKIMQRHLRIKAPHLNSDVIDRIKIHANLSLNTEKYDIAKTVLAMAKSGIYTKGELRKASGYPRLAQLPKEAFPERMTNDVRDSAAQLMKDIESETPESSGNNDDLQGKRNTTESQR